MILKNRKSGKPKSDADKSMNTMIYFMMFLFIGAGFMFPAAISIYWTIGAIFAIGQTFLLQNDKVKEKLNKLGNRKKKAKVVK